MRRGGEWKAGDYVNGAEYTCPRCAARTALAFLLTRIGSWTNATWDQHVRNEYGDEAADALHVILDEANIPIVAFQSSKVQPVKQFPTREELLALLNEGVAQLADSSSSVRYAREKREGAGHFGVVKVPSDPAPPMPATATSERGLAEAKLAEVIGNGTFVTEACRASGHGECLSYICGCPCHE